MNESLRKNIRTINKVKKDFEILQPDENTVAGYVLISSSLFRRAALQLLFLYQMNDQRRMLQHLEQVESKAGEILTDRQEIVSLDKRRNDDRVGMRALQKSKCDKTWITVGSLLIKMPSKKAEELLVQDQRECDIEINKLRSDLKVKVNELRDLELNPPVPGLMLQPMSHKEMDAINQVLGKSV